MNILGPVAALTAFLSIWFGHVAVRKIEFISPSLWLPTTLFALAGIVIDILSLSSASRPLSTVFGILGITLLIDALEFARQQKRVIKGHAPANPNNLRHALLLFRPDSQATTLDLLKRDPIGRPVNADQAIKLITEH